MSVHDILSSRLGLIDIRVKEKPASLSRKEDSATSVRDVNVIFYSPFMWTLVISVLYSGFGNKKNVKMTKQKELVVEKLKKNRSSLEETERALFLRRTSLLCAVVPMS